MGIIGKFVSSKFSGYALIALLIAAAGAGYWFWTELKEFGSLEAMAEQQAREIRSLESEAVYLQGRADESHEINSRLSETMADIEDRYRNLSASFKEELRNAPQDYINCRDMLVPERLRHPEAKDRVSDDKAGAAVDG